MTRRPLGTGTGREVPEPPPRDPRTLTAAERAAAGVAAGEWVEVPERAATLSTAAGRRPLGPRGR